MQLFADHLVHGWDLAVALGRPAALDPDDAAAALAWFAEREDAYRAAGMIGPRRADAARTPTPAPGCWPRSAGPASDPVARGRSGSTPRSTGTTWPR